VTMKKQRGWERNEDDKFGGTYFTCEDLGGLDILGLALFRRISSFQYRWKSGLAFPV